MPPRPRGRGRASFIGSLSNRDASTRFPHHGSLRSRAGAGTGPLRHVIVASSAVTGQQPSRPVGQEPQQLVGVGEAVADGPARPYVVERGPHSSGARARPVPRPAPQPTRSGRRRAGGRRRHVPFGRDASVFQSTTIHPSPSANTASIRPRSRCSPSPTSNGTSTACGSSAPTGMLERLLQGGEVGFRESVVGAPGPRRRAGRRCRAGGWRRSGARARRNCAASRANLSGRYGTGLRRRSANAVGSAAIATISPAVSRRGRITCRAAQLPVVSASNGPPPGATGVPARIRGRPRSGVHGVASSTARGRWPGGPGTPQPGRLDAGRGGGLWARVTTTVDLPPPAAPPGTPERHVQELGRPAGRGGRAHPVRSP